jgi:Putative zinc- or iron-chelating domain
MLESQPRRSAAAGQSDGDDELRQELAEGLLYTHSRLSANTASTLEARSFLYALIELLEEGGLVSIDALDERKETVSERLSEQARQRGDGVLLQDPEHDKYAFDAEVAIDCPSLVHLCHAACCKLTFALSRQDIEEGVVRWDLGKPYLIRQDADGYCCHVDRERKACTIHAHRPVPCRAFDCRNDKRIWVDFEQRIPNPNIGKPGWPRTEATTGQ